MAQRTTVSTGSTNTIAASTKFKIQQDVPSNSIKKGPYAVERAVDPNDVVIKRRFGEGSKPLFERDDISINQHQSKDFISSPVKVTQGRTHRHSSSSSSSPERYRARDPTYSSQTNSTKKLKHIKCRTQEKIPYFIDEKREKERLVRTYGSSIANNSIKRDQKTSKHHSSALRRRSSYSRSRSRSPQKNLTSHSKSASISFQKYKHSKQQNRSHERHFARSRHRSPHESERQRHRSQSSERRTRRHRRSKSRSRSRSHSNDHHKRARSPNRRNGGREHEAARPTPPIIVPMPFDPYSYAAAYPGWPHQPAWHTTARGAPRFAAPYPMPPIMPSFVGPAMFPAFRPPPPLPPYGMPYVPRMFRPPRFASRPPRGNFRQRNN